MYTFAFVNKDGSLVTIKGRDRWKVTNMTDAESLAMMLVQIARRYGAVKAIIKNTKTKKAWVHDMTKSK